MHKHCGVWYVTGHGNVTNKDPGDPVPLKNPSGYGVGGRCGSVTCLGNGMWNCSKCHVTDVWQNMTTGCKMSLLGWTQHRFSFHHYKTCVKGTATVYLGHPTRPVSWNRFSLLFDWKETLCVFCYRLNQTQAEMKKKFKVCVFIQPQFQKKLCRCVKST